MQKIDKDTGISSSKFNELIGLTKAELTQGLSDLSLPGFRARQVWHWLYHQGVQDFAQMTTLAKPLRSDLNHFFRISRPSVSNVQYSSDGTIKWLFRFL